MSALSVSKIDYAIAKLNELGIRAKGTAEAEELDIIACDAAAELAQLRARLDVACHVKAKDKVGFDWEILDEIFELRAENARMREVLENNRDLARTGLAPDIFNYSPEQWAQHKLNYIAMTSASILATYSKEKK